jgi:glutamine synthetase
MSASSLPDGIHTVDVVISDINGLMRGKKVPASHWEHVAHHGLALGDVMWNWSPRCDIFDDDVLATGVNDIEIVPDLSTLRSVPWRPGTAMVLCDAVRANGDVDTRSPRHALKQVIQRATDQNMTISCAFELEFYLLEPSTLRPRETDIQCYSPLRANLYEDVMAEIRNGLVAFGMHVEASNPEYAPGQFEINVRYDEALRTADHCMLFKYAVKDIAANHGWLASFMAKPFIDQSGCGLHVHQSIWRDGKNLFADSGKLSPLGRNYLGGLQHNMRDLTLLGSPTPNAMRRRQAYSFCPMTDGWGVDNRTVGLRVIEGGDSAVRIEQRDGSSDANIYLVLAAQLSAGLDGIEQGLEPGPQCMGDEYAAGQGNPLPLTVLEAADALEKSELAMRTFDPAMVKALADIARYEHVQIHGNGDELVADVGDAERERYAAVF